MVVVCEDNNVYEIYQFPGDNAINNRIPLTIDKNNKNIKLVNPNRLSPIELRKLVIQMAAEIVVLNDTIDDLDEKLDEKLGE